MRLHLFNQVHLRPREVSLVLKVQPFKKKNSSDIQFCEQLLTAYYTLDMWYKTQENLN